MTIIKSSSQINGILKQGEKIHSPFFTLFYFQPLDFTKLEFAVIAGKKTFKLAVTRNFVRRRLKALLRESCILELTKLQIIFIAKNPVNKLLYSKLLEEVNSKLKELAFRIKN